MEVKHNCRKIGQRFVSNITKLEYYGLVEVLKSNAALCGKFGAQRKVCPAAPC